MQKEAVGLSNTITICMYLKCGYLLETNNSWQKRHMPNSSLLRVLYRIKTKKHSNTAPHIEFNIKFKLTKVILFMHRMTLSPYLSQLHLVSECNFSLLFTTMSWFEQLVI